MVREMDDMFTTGITLNKFARTARRTLHAIAAFAANKDGVSAIEFAVVAPLMITLYLGGVEVSQAVAASRKTTLIAHTVADLVARSDNNPQGSIMSDTEIQNVFSASSAVATPYPASNLIVTVSSVNINNSGIATVAWSDSFHGTPRTKNTTVTLDPTLAVPNTSLILGEVSYTYIPTVGKVITGSLVLSDKTYSRPRTVTCVYRPPTVMTCP
jgi:Flp pilus assembly protein TadG